MYIYIYVKNSVKNQIIQYNIKNKKINHVTAMYRTTELCTKININIECNFKEIEGM